MLLSKTCVNAIRAALEVALVTSQTDRKYVPVRNIADEINVSHHFLGKIAQILIEAGILESFRGPNGGISLARPADKIYLIDIINAVDGASVFEKCILGLPECNGEAPCALHQTWAKARKALLKELRTQSLAAITRKRKKKK